MKGKLKRHLTSDQIDILEKCKKKEALKEYIEICHKNFICPKCGSEKLVRIQHGKWWYPLIQPGEIYVEFKCYEIGCDYKTTIK